MQQRQNAGYVITDALHIGGSEFVIGEHPKAPSPFVTWECTGGSNYFWGHYFSDRRSAAKDLVLRAQQELEITEPKPEKPKKARAYER